MNCRLCKNQIDNTVFSVPKCPNVGNFLKLEELGTEKLIDLDILYCNNCKSMQSKNIICANDLFINYFYKTHAINTLKNHFYDNAVKFSNEINNKNVNILEIGGNSCPFGEKLTELGYNNFINFDPSDIALKYKSNQYKLINEFFTENNTKKFLSNTKFDYIFSSNSFAHVENIHDLIKGILYISNDNTEITIEVQSLNYLINSICYPFFYHEHIYYYSQYSLIKLLEPYEFYIKNLNIIDIHGKSIQITFTKNKTKENLKLKDKIFSEKNTIFNDDIITNFKNQIIKQKELFIQFINNNKNKKIAFYGASGQANILLVFNLSNLDIKNYPIIDDSELKQNLFTPKTHLKIYPSSYLKQYNPDFVIILAYNFYREIVNKNKHINTKWFIPLPEFKIL